MDNHLYLDIKLLQDEIKRLEKILKEHNISFKRPKVRKRYTKARSTILSKKEIHKKIKFPLDKE